ncbi:MAG: choice-of-anchor J domain-containing protein, partial [Muribaculaceae bacterium]|nr:choice-of-anchor J domain-containing protein [Muribaculaceae bacterium]
KGDVMKYSGMAGLRNTSDFEIEGQTTGGGDTSDESLLFEAKFTDNQANFTIDNVTMPAGVTFVWSQSSTYGMKATSYVSGTNYDAESWLVSPVIDFTEATAPSMAFDQAWNFFADVATAKTQASVWVRVEGGSWQQLSVPESPASLSWEYINTGKIGLDAAKGKKAQIGFKYVGTATKAGTWEVKNLKVYAN